MNKRPHLEPKAVLGIGSTATPSTGESATFGFYTPTKNQKLLLTFGLSGEMTVYTRNGPVLVRNLGKNSGLISRMGGFVNVERLCCSPANENQFQMPMCVRIPAGAMGNDLPDQDTVVGHKNELTRLVSQTVENPLGQSEFSVTQEQGLDDEENDCIPISRGQLFVPILSERCQVNLNGIYVTLPGLADVEMT